MRYLFTSSCNLTQSFPLNWYSTMSVLISRSRPASNSSLKTNVTIPPARWQAQRVKRHPADFNRKPNFIFTPFIVKCEIINLCELTVYIQVGDFFKAPKQPGKHIRKVKQPVLIRRIGVTSAFAV